MDRLIRSSAQISSDQLREITGDPVRHELPVIFRRFASAGCDRSRSY